MNCTFPACRCEIPATCTLEKTVAIAEQPTARPELEAVGTVKHGGHYQQKPFYNCLISVQAECHLKLNDPLYGPAVHAEMVRAQESERVLKKELVAAEKEASALRLYQHNTEPRMRSLQGMLNEELNAKADRAQAPQPEVAEQKVWAYSTENGERIVSAKTYEGAMRDGGAMASSMRPYTVALTTTRPTAKG